MDAAHPPHVRLSHSGSGAPLRRSLHDGPQGSDGGNGSSTGRSAISYVRRENQNGKDRAVGTLTQTFAPRLAVAPSGSHFQQPGAGSGGATRLESSRVRRERYGCKRLKTIAELRAGGRRRSWTR